MAELAQLVRDVAEARARFITPVGGLSGAQANFKPDPEVWSASENVEHLVHAEAGGVSGMWAALESLREGRSLHLTPHANAGLSIEAVVERTWQPRERAPESAAPSWGGAIGYWLATLRAQQSVLEALGEALEGAALEQVVYEHPISGPLDARQRLEFLRFHLDRHRQQVERLKRHPDFPS